MKGKEERKERLKWLIKRVLLVIPVACLLLWIYAVCQTSSIKDQTKIGVTYMTMNNEFYKSIHSEISRIADEKGALVSVRDPELDEKGRASRSMILRPKVNVIVINPVKGDSQPILRALKKLENKELRSLQLIPSSSILSRMPALSPTTTKQES